MQTEGVHGVSPVTLPNNPAPAMPTWVKVWSEAPPTNSNVPVWDGDYLYYAACIDNNGYQYWVITEQPGINLDDIHLRKKQGEQVFPIQWLKIVVPKT